MSSYRAFIRAGLLGLACALAVAGGVSRAGETALDRYVKKPDNTYSWKVLKKVEAAGTTPSPVVRCVSILLEVMGPSSKKPGLCQC